MLTRKFFTMMVLLFAMTTQAQKNFIYSPENPRPGDVITITYETAGDIANTMLPVEGVYYQMGNKIQRADDIVFEKKGGKLIGTINTDKEANFIYFGFSADGKVDNNFNEGYYILINENGKPRKGANGSLGSFYMSMARRVGVEINNEKAIKAFENEFLLYPENKKENLMGYLRVLTQVKKEESSKIFQTEIEAFLKSGLVEESDYILLERLYQQAKLPEQAKLITNLKKEKFPNGIWVAGELIQKFQQEKDLVRKKELLNEILLNIETKESWSNYKQSVTFFKTAIASSFIQNKDWTSFKKAVEETQIKDISELASLYNSAAWEMQKTSDNLVLAEEFSRMATEATKEQWKNPTGKKPDYFTNKQWEKNNESTYAMFADTYGMVMYRMGNYKKGMLYAKEAAMVINNGKDPDQNNTYALNAEKALSKKVYIKEIEQFIIDGKSTGEMKEILKRAYVKNKKSETGFGEYIAALEKESQLKMIEELRKSILNETAPVFALLDLSGKKVNLAELKGKVVVVDFWATWCGPCIASFPGMQKMVNKYKNDPNVKFVFVDTWERGDTKEKNASEFIEKNKYTFHVLMDNDDKIVSEFKVEGIPTKFVIDKKGMIRFKSIGFSGSDDKLIQELTAMIEMTGMEESKKAF